MVLEAELLDVLLEAALHFFFCEEPPFLPVEVALAAVLPQEAVDDPDREPEQAGVLLEREVLQVPLRRLRPLVRELRVDCATALEEEVLLLL